MKKIIIAGLLGITFSSYLPAAHATIYFNEWTYYIDGAVSDSYNFDPAPVNGSLDSSGLGSLTYTFTGTGAHNFIGFYDFDIGNDYANEFGTNVGSLATGQSWEVGDPWYGNIYYDATGGSLTNANENSGAGDISFALGWDFTLNAGETATITMNLADALPTTTPGFYLQQYDATSPTSIYDWSTLDITGPSNSVPEPTPLALMGIGVLGFGIARKKVLKRDF